MLARDFSDFMTATALEDPPGPDALDAGVQLAEVLALGASVADLDPRARQGIEFLVERIRAQFTIPALAADFEWTHFFELAQELGRRENEAAQRCAVSRSYYAVFHTAKLVLERIDPAFASMHSHDSHKQVWDRLATLNQRQAKNALRKSRSLLHARRDADYRVQAGDWPRRTQAALHDAEQALSSLAELLP